MLKKLFGLALALLATLAVSAQVRVGEGQLSGSFESNSIYYQDDSGLGAAGTAPDDRFGSNNYMKLDYMNGRFSAGLQIDAYLPALQGYEIGQQPGAYHFYLSSKYIQWQDHNYSVRVGDIFDQFGSGLIFRSFEDRQLGFNNSIEGVQGIYRFGDYVEVKGMYGRPRLYTDYADSWVRGADLHISLNDIFGWNAAQFSAEGSYVNRYESLDKDQTVDFASRGLTSPNLNMYSGRLNFDWKGLSLKGEYVYKGKDIYSTVADVAAAGNAILVEAGYNYGPFSISGSFRRLDRMGTMLSLYGSGTGNVLNYLPSLTRQYTYLLANLEPYIVNTDGEIGGQVDLYYTYRSKSNRHRYWNFHANLSTFYTLRSEQSESGERELMWRDINIDVERQWNKKLKTSLLVSIQKRNPSHGFQRQTYVSNIFIGDVTYKFDSKKSLRVEAQYLYSTDYEGDWVAALVEFNMVPHWSFFVSDMYNLDETEANSFTKTNYYSAGFSYLKNRTRIQLSYGRNRAGYVCSGGACRYMPAYTGLNLVITSSF